MQIYLADDVDMDDEYASAGVKDPKILLTTARDPSSRLAQFAKVSWYIGGTLMKALSASLFCLSTTRMHLYTDTDHSWTRPILKFVQEMRLVFPNATRINRGSTVMREMSEACRTNDYTDLIVLHEHRGQPGELFIARDRLVLLQIS